MVNWKKISQIFKKAVGIFLLLLLFHYFFRRTAEISHYQEYIKGEENIPAGRNVIAKGAENLDEINKIEEKILQEIEKKSQREIKESQELRELKVILKNAEQDHQQKKEELEKATAESKKLPLAITSSFNEEQRKIVDACGKATFLEMLADNYRKAKLEELGGFVIKNIKEELKKNKLTIIELDIAYEEGTKDWKNRSFWNSLWLDPQRFFFIKPLQWISKNLGINTPPSSSKNEWIYILLDMLLKVFVMRLLLNWISYPPKFDLSEPSSQNSPTDLYSLEEEKEIATQKLKEMKEMLFNGAMFIFTALFLSHPFSFDRDNNLYKWKINFYFVIPYLSIYIFSSFLTTRFYQEITLKEYLVKSWISSLALPLGYFLYIYWGDNQLGYYLPFLLSEFVNIFIYSIKIFFRSHRVGRNDSQKVAWKNKN